MSAPLIGQLAGLGTALCWVFTSFLFAAASRRLGAGAVNLLRSILAMLLLFALHAWLLGTLWPAASGTAIAWLAASGIVGLALGDQFLFGALVDLGPRLATLLMTLAPACSALVAWLLLGEVLSALAAAGIAATLGGIAIVVRERPRPGDRPIEHLSLQRRSRGLVLGVLAAMGQGVGYVMAKQGMVADLSSGGGAIPPLAAQLVRMTGAVCFLVAIWGMVGPRPWLVGADWRAAPPRLSRVAVLGLVGGSVLGPVIGVWLSLIAVRRLDAGVAATLIALSPVLVLPFARLIDRERISPRAVLGAIVAVLGIALLAGSAREMVVDLPESPEWSEVARPEGGETPRLRHPAD